jgi:hypothetical protein
MKESNGFLSLYMKDGSVVNAVSGHSNGHTSHVSVLSEMQLSGFEGTLSLHEDSSLGMCELKYSFKVLVGEGFMKSSIFYDTFVETFIPDVFQRAMQ